MVTLSIEIDESADRALRELAEQHGGDLGKAVEELLASRQALELMADDLEDGNEEYLKRQLDRSLRDFAQGRVVDWETVKARNQL
jgi:hypothetical protein